MSFVKNLPRNLLVILVNETTKDMSEEATRSLNNIFTELVKRDIHPDIINSLRQTGRINVDSLPETPIDELELLSNFMLRSKKLGDPTWNYAIDGSIKVAPNILDDQIDNFFNIYSDAIYAEKTVKVAEKYNEFGPIVLDLDFRHIENQRYYTTNMIVKCITLYNQIIKKYLNVSNGNMIAYIMEKKNPKSYRDYYRDGLHIMYPNICVKFELQLLMQKDFAKKLLEENVFGTIPLLDTNVVDECFTRSWLLYGSTKSGCEPYELTQIYKLTDSTYGEYLQNIFNTYSINNKIDGKFTKSAINHLVRYLSVRKFKNESDLTPVVVVVNKPVSDENLILAKRLIPYLSAERAHNPEKWYELGHCLHNIDERLFVDWVEFSKKDPIKFNEDDCKSAWTKMKRGIYTMRSLHWFASQDTPAYRIEIEKKADEIRYGNLPSLIPCSTTEVKVENKEIISDIANCTIDEPIGIVADCAISEPITASNLKSFHKQSSGGAVANGLPRVRELLGVNTKAIVEDKLSNISKKEIVKRTQDQILKEIIDEMKSLDILKIHIKKDKIRVEYKLKK